MESGEVRLGGKYVEKSGEPTARNLRIERLAVEVGGKVHPSSFNHEKRERGGEGRDSERERGGGRERERKRERKRNGEEEFYREQNSREGSRRKEEAYRMKFSVGYGIEFSINFERATKDRAKLPN